jgi:hypothetical protein
VPAHSDDSDDVERTVRGAVVTAGEALPPGSASVAARRDSAEFRKGGLDSDPARVIADGDQELSSNFEADLVASERLLEGYVLLDF